MPGASGLAFETWDSVLDSRPVFSLTKTAHVYTISYVRRLDLRWKWDPEKAKKNLEKHKVSFELAERALGDPLCITVPDPYPNEERWRTLGSPSVDGIVVL